MKNKKARIDTYYCNIYGVYLVVANRYADIKDLQKLYRYANGEELDNPTDSISTTYLCKRKSDNALVLLVKYNRDSLVKSVDKTLDFINTCSHEATHVALDIYESISQNVCFCTPEPFCYLVGWVTECIYKTLKNK